MNKMKILLLHSILFVVLASCQARITDRPVAEKILHKKTAQTLAGTLDTTPSRTVESVSMTPTHLATNRVLSTKTATYLPMPSPSKASWAIWTPIAPVPLPTAKSNIEELLKTNGGCSLPCWWGIYPAKTSFTTGLKQLSPLATFIAVNKTDDKGSLDAEFRFPVSETNLNREFTVVDP